MLSKTLFDSDRTWPTVLNFDVNDIVAGNIFPLDFLLISSFYPISHIVGKEWLNSKL